MSFSNLADYNLIDIYSYLYIRDASNIMISNKLNKKLIQKYYESTIQKIKCDLCLWHKTFPNATKLYIQRFNRINNSKSLKNIKILDVSLYHYRIDIDIVSNLQNLTNLNLQGYSCDYAFTDQMFNYLPKLRKLYIDNNHKITNAGLNLLEDLEDLHISNCSKITDKGIENLVKLTKLTLYNMSLTDKVFIKLVKLKELYMTFQAISDVGICYLINLERLTIITCYLIQYINYDKLLHLKYINIVENKMTNIDYSYLSKIKHIEIYGCDLCELDLKYFSNVQILSIIQCSIVDEQLDNVQQLKNLQKINIYRCHISKEKLYQIQEKLGKNKLYTNLISV